MQHRPSPNFDNRFGEGVPNMLVLHYTGMEAAEAALARMCDPKTKVSAHYLIDTNGAITVLVEEGKRAWHAGLAYWQGETDINSVAIGIEIHNPGHGFGYVPFPEPQIDSLITLVKDILGRHEIPADRVLGHSDIAPARKDDPGELFPWKRLAREGIGRWPKKSGPSKPADQMILRDLMTQFGYDPGAPLEKIIKAFQRHWQPEKVDGVADEVTWGRLRALL